MYIIMYVYIYIYTHTGTILYIFVVVNKRNVKARAFIKETHPLTVTSST